MILVPFHTLLQVVYSTTTSSINIYYHLFILCFSYTLCDKETLSMVYYYCIHVYSMYPCFVSREWSSCVQRELACTPPRGAVFSTALLALALDTIARHGHARSLRAWFSLILLACTSKYTRKYCAVWCFFSVRYYIFYKMYARKIISQRIFSNIFINIHPRSFYKYKNIPQEMRIFSSTSIPVLIQVYNMPQRVVFNRSTDHTAVRGGVDSSLRIRRPLDKDWYIQDTCIKTFMYSSSKVFLESCTPRKTKL